MDRMRGLVAHLLVVVVGALGCTTNPGVMSGNGGGSGNGRAPDKLPPAGGGGGGNGGTGAGGTNPTGPTGDKNCGLKSFDLERKPARMLLVLDRSGSMRESIGLGGGDKWTAATGASQEVIMKTQGAVHWGLKMFPGDVECSVTPGVAVPVAPDNFPPIQASIAMTMPTGTGTPTRMAIRDAVAYLKSLPDGPTRYLVLATDGQPNCMDDISSNLPDAPAAVAAVAEAATAGFPTFVIGVAIEGTMGNNTLNQMALAGMEARAGAVKYYAAASRADLVAALDVITGTVTNCAFPLDEKPPSPNDVAVEVDGMRILRDQTHMNGWDYATDRTIQLYGPACDAVKAQAMPNVRIIFGCPGVVIP